ncbi:MAG: fumarylacetoacetate hydrolase family protein [Clostridiales bacterium]|jgi:2-keto-4-pentenoate hydratase/2-oxohepta-3-ene-1,7-dioic acid hydratase in catechol pathway|nr:fumarylacetoacetate hydrolase family protein [Clostridiales bacterium]
MGIIRKGHKEEAQRMKYLRYEKDGRASYGLLQGDGSVREIAGDLLGEFEPTGRELPLGSVKLLAPVFPPNVIAIGLNYRDHAAESRAALPQRPLIFLKATSSVAAHGEPIRLPAEAPGEVDYEAELAVVIKKTARAVEAADAGEYILGYACGNDVSARDCQMRLDSQWARAKSFDTFCPIGPWIETELDPGRLAIRSKVNGKIMQDGSTADMVFSVSELVSYCSKNMTLLPGTVIMTGTPNGVGFARKPPVFLRAGDVVEIEIEGIGALRNPVI